jgi:DNA-binding MurR/RpiR family transcriptional regulator
MAFADSAAIVRPATLDELRTAMATASEQFSPRVRDAARHALDHPNDIALNPVAAVAKTSGIAASAFIRLAQALGFSGYGELQKLFREPLQRGAKSSLRERIRHFGGEQPIRDATDPVDVLRAFSQANVLSLDHLRDEAATLPLAAAIRLIRNARMVYVLGLRRSYAVAAYLAYALPRVGRPAVQLTGLGGALAEQARAIGPRDLLIAISFPPYAADTLAVCEQVHAAGGRRLALTDTVLSPFARDAALVLQVNDAELQGFRSLTSALCLAQSLAMGIAFAGRRRRGADASATLVDIDC